MKSNAITFTPFLYLINWKKDIDPKNEIFVLFNRNSYRYVTSVVSFDTYVVSAYLYLHYNDYEDILTYLSDNPVITLGEEKNSIRISSKDTYFNVFLSDDSYKNIVKLTQLGYYVKNPPSIEKIYQKSYLQEFAEEIRKIFLYTIEDKFPKVAIYNTHLNYHLVERVENITLKGATIESIISPVGINNLTNMFTKETVLNFINNLPFEGIWELVDILKNHDKDNIYSSIAHLYQKYMKEKAKISPYYIDKFLSYIKPIPYINAILILKKANLLDDSIYRNINLLTMGKSLISAQSKMIDVEVLIDMLIKTLDNFTEQEDMLLEVKDIHTILMGILLCLKTDKKNRTKIFEILQKLIEIDRNKFVNSISSKSIVSSKLLQMYAKGDPFITRLITPEIAGEMIVQIIEKKKNLLSFSEKNDNFYNLLQYIYQNNFMLIVHSVLYLKETYPEKWEMLNEEATFLFDETMESIIKSVTSNILEI